MHRGRFEPTTQYHPHSGVNAEPPPTANDRRGVRKSLHFQQLDYWRNTRGGRSTGRRLQTKKKAGSEGQENSRRTHVRGGGEGKDRPIHEKNPPAGTLQYTGVHNPKVRED